MALFWVRTVRKGSCTLNPVADSIKVMAMYVSKGLSFPWWASATCRFGARAGGTRPGCFM